MPFPTSRTWLCLAVAVAVQHTGVEGSNQAHHHASQRITFPKWSDTNFLEDGEHFGPAAASTDMCPSSLNYIYQVDVDVTNFQSYGREMPCTFIYLSPFSSMHLHLASSQNKCCRIAPPTVQPSVTSGYVPSHLFLNALNAQSRTLGWRCTCP